MTKTGKIAIVGAGPAGLSAAIAASEAGVLEIVVFEKMPKPGLKLLASGGGRCNITNSSSTDDFLKAYGRHGRFCLPALNALPPQKLLEFLHQLGVPTYSPDGFHIFPRTEKASDVLDALLSKCARAGISIECGTTVSRVKLEDSRAAGIIIADKFYPCDKIIIASGGAGYPSLGGGLGGYEIAKSAGHSIIPPVPALVELHIEDNPFSELSGISIPDIILTIKKGRSSEISQGILLFTHKGITGPAVLDISGRITRLLAEKEPFECRISFIASEDRESWNARLKIWRQNSGSRKISNLLSELMPLALARKLCLISGAGDRTAAEITSRESQNLVEALAGLKIKFSGSSGFEKAMATSGGVSTREVNPDTMESRIAGGLFFAGEAIDIHGPCGGYNLQWAFSSGWLAGTLAAKHLAI